ncbi:hypothetical protein M569_03693 [Genlisea aurea]|uniref:NAC domain-containing protein n=1 Tax=Genlisea aurea TaxID=192259 RepID=S8D152_9LAMI|nr:hypothetical protein M569_03693 [Genlisea aurea]
MVLFHAAESQVQGGGQLNRVARDGYWKRTGKEKLIYRDDERRIGFLRTSAFYTGLRSNEFRTHWMMDEFTADGVSDRRGRKESEKFALCKIYINPRHRGNPDANLDRQPVDTNVAPTSEQGGRDTDALANLDRQPFDANAAPASHNKAAELLMHLDMSDALGRAGPDRPIPTGLAPILGPGQG